MYYIHILYIHYIDVVFKRIAYKEWKNIKPSHLQLGYESNLRPMKAVVDANRGHSDYWSRLKMFYAVIYG